MDELTSHITLSRSMSSILHRRVNRIAHIRRRIPWRRPRRLPPKHAVHHIPPLPEPALGVLVPGGPISIGDEVDVPVEVALDPRLEALGADVADTKGAHDGVGVGPGAEVRGAGDVVGDDLGVGVDVTGLVEVKAEKELEAGVVGVVEELADSARGPRLVGLADVEGEGVDAQGEGLVDVELCMAATLCDGSDLCDSSVHHCPGW